MEIKSEPGFRDVEYQDHDFLFISGHVQSFSVKPAEGDTFIETDALFVLQTVSPKETVTVYKAGLAGHSTRQRLMRFPLAGPPLPASGSSSPAVSSVP